MFTQEIVDFTTYWMLDLYDDDRIGSHTIKKENVQAQTFAREHKAEVVEYLKCKKNINKVFPGLDELEHCLSEWAEYRGRLDSALESDGIGWPTRPRHAPKHYIDLYPQAYGYLQAHRYFESDNPEKSRIGNKAMTRLMNGDSAADVIPSMQAEWAKCRSDAIKDD